MKHHPWWTISCVAVLVAGLSPVAGEVGTPLVPAGVATVDITPAEPVRLSGYGARAAPSEGVSQRLHAKALALGGELEGSEAGPPLSIAITFDGIGVTWRLRAELAKRLGASVGLDPAQLVVAATHSHTAPALTGCIPFLFHTAMTPDEEAAVGRYTDLLTDRLEEVALAAVRARHPARLDWGKGEVGFAVNRRTVEGGTWKGFGVTPDAPVDHRLPVLRVRGEDGTLRAVWVTYACHCTTFGPDHNHVHGDWAGCAREAIESRFPGAAAMVSVGCAGDQNPNPRGDGAMEAARAHGESVAAEVARVLMGDLEPVGAAPLGKLATIELALDPAPGRAHWEAQAAGEGSGARFAQSVLDGLDRGEAPDEVVEYPVQTWTFGEDLAMIFLGGEVVVDYAHRFYRELDAGRLWVHAYCNDVPCYIASERLYPEGGYEVDGSMTYYGKPARLARGTEERVASEVLRQLPHTFYSKVTRTWLPPPRSPEESLAAVRVPAGFEATLVAAEPVVADPVDIAWGPDGRLWVVEMADYPQGIDGEPGGRVRVLENPDRDGRYRRSTIFLDGLAYPNSVLPWRDGILVVTRSSIVFARDTDGDGRADETVDRVRGFSSGNPQHQLAGLQWGLDNRVHVANGHASGPLVSGLTGESLELGARDLSFDPDTGHLRAESGLTQFGRNRDDWGNWFGCDNTRPFWHYALDDRYLARNPHVAAPDPKVMLGGGAVYPASRTLERFNDHTTANRFTSACGVTPYRGEALGVLARRSLFVAEPVHNLVSRVVTKRAGGTFTAARAPGEERAEFFASADNWCRPTAVRTGPDGALYVVDFYRFVIEHPEWIPTAWQRRIDLRAGEDRGRIYRVARAGAPAAPQPDLTAMDVQAMVEMLGSPNGTLRDLLHQLIVWRGDLSAVPALEAMAADPGAPAGSRVQALAVMDGLGAVSDEVLLVSLADPHPGVRRQAVRLAGARMGGEAAARALLPALVPLARDPAAEVRKEAAYALGESNDDMAGEALADLLAHDGDDPYLRAAAMSSAAPHVQAIARALGPRATTLHLQVVAGLVQTAAGAGETGALASMLETFGGEVPDAADLPARFDTLAVVVSAMAEKGTGLRDFAGGGDAALAKAAAGLGPLFGQARELAADADADLGQRVRAVAVLGAAPDGHAGDLGLLGSLLEAAAPVELQLAAVRRLAALGGDSVPGILLGRWAHLGPSVKREIVVALLGRTGSTAALLEEAAGRPELVRALDAAQRATLLHHRDVNLRRRAEAVLGAVASPDKEALISRFADHPGPGDAEAGRGFFAALCATCHQLEGAGFHVGPDLAALTDRSREALLAAIIDPNRAVEEKFALYLAETNGGETVTGIVSSETATGITLLGPGGLGRTVSRDDLASLSSPGVSLMPEGLADGIDPSQMSDLIAYLQQDAGAFPAIAPDDSGALSLTAATAAASGPSVATDPASGALSWIGPDDVLQWAIEGLAQGTYAVFFDAARQSEGDASPGAFLLAVGDAEIAGTVEHTGRLSAFRQRLFGEITVGTGPLPTTARFRHTHPHSSLAVREIRLVPRGTPQ